MRVALQVLIASWIFWGALAGAVTPSYRELEGLQIGKFEIRGLPSDLEKALEKGLSLATPAKHLKSRSSLFHAKVLEEDRQRTLLFLAQCGYPRAQVLADVKRGKGRKVNVTLDVRPGSPVIISNFVLEGVPNALVKKATKALQPSRGKPVVDAEVAQAAQTIESKLRDAGYALAKVSAQVAPLDSSRVQVRLVAVTGERYVFGATRVSGVAPDLVPLAVRTLDISPGTLYSPKTMKDAQDNLRLLDMFRQIRLTTKPAQGDTLDVIAELSPRDPHTVEAKAGYMSEDLFRARLRWAGHNTFSGGRGLEASASYSQFHQEVKLSTWWPALIGPRTREVLTLRGLREDEDSYSELGGWVEVASWYRKSFRTTYRLFADFGYTGVDFTSQYEDDFEGIMTVLGVSWNLDTSDDRLRPSRGFVGWVEGKVAPRFLPAEAPFVRGEAGASLYFSLPKRCVLAQRLVVGVADPLEDTHRLLPSLRFYAGGVNSNRGFERRMLGPLYPDEEPAGGEAKVESLTEVRFPLVWKLYGALFLDVGQVWSQIDAMVLDALQPSAGWALMVDSPVGPIRVDMGYRLRDPGDQPGHVFHFLIGHPF
jgi:outer membrane protein insertion porin family